MLNISKRLFETWNEKGLKYCHWKSNEHLLPGLDGDTDLDVLLSLDDKAKGEELLRSIDFMKCRSQYGSRYPDVDDWMGFDTEKGNLIHLHLHYQLVTGHKGMKEYNLPWTQLALDTRILNDEFGVYTMEPNLELVTLFTRIGLKADFKNILRCRIGKFHFPKDVKREIDWLKERVDMEKVYDLLNNFYGVRTNDVEKIMQLDKIDSKSYLKLSRITESVFKKNSRIKSFIRLREVSFFIYQRFLQRLIKHFRILISKKVPENENGLTVAFLGQDGAGKTTVTKDIIKWWSWKLDVRNIYLGSGDNYSSIKKKLSRMMPCRGPLKYLRSYLSLSDSKDRAKRAYKNVKMAEKYASKGGLVIYDRYPQMEYEGICDGPKIRKRLQSSSSNHVFYKLFSPLANKEEKYIRKIVSCPPDIVFKLILSPEESMRRKPHENYEEVKVKHEIIKSLKFESSDAYTIDATMPYDEELLLIKSKIWQHIQK